MQYNLINQLYGYLSAELYANESHLRKDIFTILKDYEPKPNKDFASPVELAKFKRQQRDFDNLVLDLKLETPEKLEEKNSLISPSTKIRVLEFGESRNTLLVGQVHNHYFCIKQKNCYI